MVKALAKFNHVSIDELNKSENVDNLIIKRQEEQKELGAKYQEEKHKTASQQ